MNPNQHITQELNEAVASARFNKRSTCAWEALDPLTRGCLRALAGEFLKDAIPALLEAGWTPPTTQGPTP